MSGPDVDTALEGELAEQNAALAALDERIRTLDAARAGAESRYAAEPSVEGWSAVEEHRRDLERARVERVRAEKLVTDARAALAAHTLASKRSRLEEIEKQATRAALRHAIAGPFRKLVKARDAVLTAITAIETAADAHAFACAEAVALAKELGVPCAAEPVEKRFALAAFIAEHGGTLLPASAAAWLSIRLGTTDDRAMRNIIAHEARTRSRVSTVFGILGKVKDIRCVEGLVSGTINGPPLSTEEAIESALDGTLAQKSLDLRRSGPAPRAELEARQVDRKTARWGKAPSRLERYEDRLTPSPAGATPRSINEIA